MVYKMLKVGKLDSELMCYTGMNTVETLSGYHADVAFVSCTGVSLDNGLTDSDECEAKIRSTMMISRCRKPNAVLLRRKKAGRS